MFKSWSAFKGSAITESLSFIWVFRLSTRLFTTRWKLAILRGLGNRKVVAILKAAIPGVFTLPKAVAASIT